MKYYLIVGEASGDLHAAHLMTALKDEDSLAQFRYFGGERMQEVGGTLVRHYKETAFMGFLTVLLNARKVLANFKLCRQDLLEYQPDVVILVDYPGFNLKMAKFVKQHLSCPVFYYISPKIWAWKEGRIKQIRQYVDRIFSILPFEVEFFQRHNYKIDYVGNPSYDEIVHYLSGPVENDEINRIESTSQKPILVLLPGSRTHEILENLPQMIEASIRFTTHQIVIAGAPNADRSVYEQAMNGASLPVVFGASFELLRKADAAIVVSGTATLECALFNTPQVIVYYKGGGAFFLSLYLKMIKTRFVSLVNLVADEEVCRELLGYHTNEEEIASELDNILNDLGYRDRMLSGYNRIRKRLGDVGAPKRAARLIVEAFKKEQK